jgi:hypothetical protein
MMRYASIWKDSESSWWLDLADEEHGEYHEATTYGPFRSEKKAGRYLSDEFSNPGGYNVDDRGTNPPPEMSPDGGPTVKPGRKAGLGGRAGFGGFEGSRWGGRW